MRKKTILISPLLILLLALSACGSGDADSAGAAAGEKPDGFWSDSNQTAVVIDGKTGYLVMDRRAHPCAIDTRRKTITVKDYALNGKDPVYSYEFVNGELRLVTDNDKAYRGTMILAKDENAVPVEDKESIDGKWTDQNETTISIDGEDGYCKWNWKEYPCSVNARKRTITVKEFAFDRSDVEYSYDLVYDTLLLDTDADLVPAGRSVLMVPSS